MEKLLTIVYQQLIKTTPEESHRFLFQKLNLKDRLTGIVGPRGAGKTTLMLQYIKKHLDPEQAFYFSADHIYFTQNTIYEFIANIHLNEQTRYFFIDEIHKYKNWSQELKNIYDGFPQIKIVFSGSSSLDLVKGSHDLSRRAILMHLPGMSFREYLNLTQQSNHQKISLNSLLKDPVKISEPLLQIPKILSSFKSYLTHGFYPFYYEQADTYYQKLLNIIDKTIFEDIAEFYNLKTNHLHSLRKLVLYLANCKPGTVSTHNLAKNLSVDDKTVLKFLVQLEETGLINRVYPAEPGSALLKRPEKIFLANTNLSYALEERLNKDIDIGNIRELFFIQALESAGHKVFHSKSGDYEAEKHTFEVGGKNKKTKQIAGKENSYLIKDDIQTVSKREIPLWLMGFLY